MDYFLLETKRAAGFKGATLNRIYGIQCWSVFSCSTGHRDASRSWTWLTARSWSYNRPVVCKRSPVSARTGSQSEESRCQSLQTLLRKSNRGFPWCRAGPEPVFGMCSIGKQSDTVGNIVQNLFSKKDHFTHTTKYIYKIKILRRIGTLIIAIMWY